MYQAISSFAERFFTKAQIFKYGFNFSPMYKRTTARIISVSDDLFHVKIKIPISWKNKNYVGSIFGGSLFAATDPIYMIQLFQILGKDYVVWDKSTNIKFKRPVYKTVFAEFVFTAQEIEQLKKDVYESKEVDYVKHLNIIDNQGNIYCSLEKIIYVANKAYYKQKQLNRKKV